MSDPFEALGVPARFDIDPAGVQAAYLRAVAACHPDLAGDDPELAAEAARRSAALNRAQRELLDPEARARALLARLAGGEPTGDERELPEGFLAEILETRMAAQEAGASGDREEIARLRSWAAAERARHIERVGELFRELKVGPGERAAETAREIRRRLNAWRYIERMLEQVGGHG